MFGQGTWIDDHVDRLAVVEVERGEVFHEGSWWTDWAKWLGAHRGKEVPARAPGKGRLKVIEAAPGSYARIRADGR